MESKWKLNQTGETESKWKLNRTGEMESKWKLNQTGEWRRRRLHKTEKEKQIWNGKRGYVQMNVQLQWTNRYP
jgi:hypothetical protein